MSVVYIYAEKFFIVSVTVLLPIINVLVPVPHWQQSGSSNCTIQSSSSDADNSFTGAGRH